MSVASPALNQQIELCAGALQQCKNRRLLSQQQLFRRLQTPLLLGGFVLLGIGFCCQRAGDPVVSSTKQRRISWLQRLPLWLLTLWQLVQRAPVR